MIRPVFYLSFLAMILGIEISFAQSTLTHGPILGAVTDSSIKVFGRTSQAASVKVLYKKTSDASFTSSTTINTVTNNDLTATILVSNLLPNTQYDYQLVVDDVAAAVSTFTTLPSVDQPARFSFTVGADLLDFPFTIMDSMDAKNPLFNLLIGDTVYADAAPAAATLDEFRAKYKLNFSEPSLANFFRKHPTLFTWDDHEIQNNWEKGAVGLYIPARQAYNEYVNTLNPSPRTSRNLYFSYKAGEVEFYFFDTRTFRSKSNAPDNSTKSMLGATQKADFKNWLATSTAKFKFVVSSVPFSDFGTTSNDSWIGYQTEKAEILNFINTNNVKGVMLITGDQHFSMVARLNNVGPKYNLYEFLPTPLATQNRTAPATVDSQILFKQDKKHNYGFFTVDTTVTPATLTYINYDDNNNPLYTLTINQNDINPPSSSPPPPLTPEIIVDNSMAGSVSVIGSWPEVTSVREAQNLTYLHDDNAGKGTKTVKFTPTIPTTGVYDVYVRWPGGGTNRANNARFTLLSQGGGVTYSVNQQVQSNSWIHLGTHTFVSGSLGYVMIKNESTTGYVIADAVKFSPHSTSRDGISDSWKMNYWGWNFAADPSSLPGADPDGDGMNNLAEFTAGTSPLDPHSKVDISSASPIGDNFVVEWPGVGGVSYDVEWSTDMNQWIWADRVIPSMTGPSSWTDDGSRTEGVQPSSTLRRFYRVKIPN
jgi:phosphodiesterase/alkaline phosphatase D-like protein